MDHCDQCQYRYEDLAVAQVGPTLLQLAAEYDIRLVGAARLLRAHPFPGTWSALEYSCHHRDTLRVQRERIRQAIVEDCPEFVPMGREERVVADHYNDQDPRTVARELVSAANALAADLARLEPEQWERTCIYTWPTRSERTVAWVGRHTVHEGIHHLGDFDRVVQAV